MREQELAVALAADPRAAFEDLVRCYQDRIFAFALGLCGLREDAEEVAQEAFLNAYRALTSYGPDQIAELRLSAWLHQIALNVERNRRRRRRPQSAALWEQPDPRPGPDQLVETAMLLRLLPDRYRSAVVLRHVQGFSYEEASAILGLPVGTVKSNVHRGLELLRGRLAEVEVGNAV